MGFRWNTKRGTTMWLDMFPGGHERSTNLIESSNGMSTSQTVLFEACRSDVTVVVDKEKRVTKINPTSSHE